MPGMLHNHVDDVSRSHGPTAIHIASGLTWLWIWTALKHKAYQVDDVRGGQGGAQVHIAGHGDGDSLICIGDCQTIVTGTADPIGIRVRRVGTVRAEEHLFGIRRKVQWPLIRIVRAELVSNINKAALSRCNEIVSYQKAIHRDDLALLIRAKSVYGIGYVTKIRIAERRKGPNVGV